MPTSITPTTTPAPVYGIASPVPPCTWSTFAVDRCASVFSCILRDTDTLFTPSVSAIDANFANGASTVTTLPYCATTSQSWASSCDTAAASLSDTNATTRFSPSTTCGACIWRPRRSATRWRKRASPRLALSGANERGFISVTCPCWKRSI